MIAPHAQAQAGDWVFDGPQYAALDPKEGEVADPQTSGYSQIEEDVSVERARDYHDPISQTAPWGEDTTNANGSIVRGQVNDTVSIKPRESAGHSRHKGKVRVWFRYVPRQIRDAATNQMVNDPTDKPSRLNVLITASASASASDGGVTPEFQQRNSNYGEIYYLTNPANYKASASAMGQEATPVVVPDPNTGKVSAMVTVKRLIDISDGDKMRVATPWCDIRAEASVTGDRLHLTYYGKYYPHYNTNVVGATQAGGSYNVERDDRSVALTRSGATNEWQTIENGVPVTHGDTIYSFTEHSSVDTPTWVPVKQEFQSALSGNWTSGNNPAWLYDSGGYNIAWNWTTSDGLEEYSNLVAPTQRQADAKSYTRWNGMSRVTEKGELEPWYSFPGNTGPTYTDEGNPKRRGKPKKTATVKYFVRDNDDEAEAEARYELTIHEPIEIETGEDKKFLKRVLVDMPVRFQGEDGVWRLVSPMSVPEDAAPIPKDKQHPLPAGSYQVGVTKGAGKSRGRSYGFEIGGGFEPLKKFFNVNGSLNHQWTQDYSWYKELSATAVMQEDLFPGEAARLVARHTYERYRTIFRRYTEQGEIRSEGSPALPAPSIPFRVIWDELQGDPNYPMFLWEKVADNQSLGGAVTELPVYETEPSAGES